MIKLKQCLEKIGDIDASSGLCLDVSIRWNSTYFMLQGALEYQGIFGSLCLVDENYKYCPSEEELEREGKICRFLLSFYDISAVIFATSYPTSNLKFFFQVLETKCLLIESVKEEDEVVKDMSKMMMVKFDILHLV